MMNGGLWFVIGTLTGFFLGALVISMCAAAGRADNNADLLLRLYIAQSWSRTWKRAAKKWRHECTWWKEQYDV